MIRELSDDFGHFLSFEEGTLRDATVLYFFLSDEDALIGEVVVDLYGSNAIVFEPAFDNCFLEVGIEPQHFSIIFEPRRLDSWDVVVLRSLSGLHEAHVIDRFAHLVQKILIYIFLIELPFFLNRAVHAVELLSFMEVLLVWVVEDVTRQERHLLGNVCLHC